MERDDRRESEWGAYKEKVETLRERKWRRERK